MNQKKFSPRNSLNKHKNINKGETNAHTKSKSRENSSKLNCSQDSVLPKLPIHSRQSLISSIRNHNINKNSFGCRSIFHEGSEFKSFSPRSYLKNLPARFKHISKRQSVVSIDYLQSLFVNKEDIELIQKSDPNEVRVSIEYAKNIMCIEESLKKGKILKKCKESSWKWLSPRCTPLKEVKFKEEQ